MKNSVEPDFDVDPPKFDEVSDVGPGGFELLPITIILIIILMFLIK